MHLPAQMLAELLLESMVEQGVVDLLCSSLSAHERHQGVLAVALRTLVLLTEDGKAVCVHRGLLVVVLYTYACSVSRACVVR